MVLLLSLTTGGALARFLQPANTNGTLVISPAPNKPPTITYNQSLSCGECILGNYIYCVNGPENYTGAVAPKAICCKDLGSCKEAKLATYTCSSKYNANQYTIFDRLKVCPFNPDCGKQVLSLNDADDSQCLRLNTIKKGSSCVYRVQSKCNAPNFAFNDTSNVYSTFTMLSNTSIVTPPIPQGSCQKQVNDQCLCKVVSTFDNATNATSDSLLCDCNLVKNYTIASPSTCQCSVLKDSQGNEMRKCSCPVLVADQYAVDQECACNLVSGLFKNTTSLSCYDSCGIATPASPLTFLESQCSCVSAFNFTSNKTYQSCVCKNVP